MVVAVGWSQQALRTGDKALKYHNAATRVLPGDQEANRERPKTDDLDTVRPLAVAPCSCQRPLRMSAVVMSSAVRLENQLRITSSLARSFPGRG